MATQVVYPFGASADIVVPVGSKIAVGVYDRGVAQVYYKSTAANAAPNYSFQQEVNDGEVVLGTFSATQIVRLEAGPQPVFYEVAVAPVVQRLLSSGVSPIQGAPTAKTVSATLTAAEVLAGIITVNQGAGAASALQLPTAAAMDTALTGFSAGDSFDISLINISTVAAEDASLTTNTGWTLVGNMDVASNAAATDKSAGRFRLRKTGAAAWTIYRLS